MTSSPRQVLFLENIDALQVEVRDGTDDSGPVTRSLSDRTSASMLRCARRDLVVPVASRSQCFRYKSPRIELGFETKYF